MKINLVNANFGQDYAKMLLTSRGVEDVDAFLNPTREHLQSPLNLKNIRTAAELYTRVVKAGGKVLIIVDSDNDGYTSAAIIYQYTKRLNPNCQVDYWLHEGKQHGLQDHIDKLMERDEAYDLIILPDSSSNDAHYHDMLEGINTPCLILDHHLTDVKLSYNAIVVNNQLSPNYTNKELTGAGVVYQFCRYVDEFEGLNWADDYIDLAAWGIIGDMGSVLEMENRYLIVEGLKDKNIKNKFFKALLEKQAYSITKKMYATWDDIVEKLTPMAVAFYIVPLVNGMIRVGTMEEKERLFVAFIDGDRMIPSGKRGAKGTFERAAVEAARECANAKARQDKAKLAAVEKLEQKIFKYDLLENRVLFVRLDDTDRFPSELNGLIAMQLAAKYKKPTIVARLNDQGFDRGSARGVDKSELKDFKQFLMDSGYFEYAQGHANAFGISIDDENLRDFHNYANEALANYNFGENAHDVNFIRSADSDDLSNLILDVASLTPTWGQGNKEALIYVRPATITTSNIFVMGSNKEHLRITINGIEYVKFYATELIEKIQSAGRPVQIEMVCKAAINEWGGQRKPQMLVEDCEITIVNNEF
jgi:single-stranded-DNA-specific exonuclease